MKKIKGGFTLIELLIIVAIISLLVIAILVSINQARENARITGTKTSMKSALPAIVACNDGGGNINMPGSGGSDICQTAVGLANTKWPALSYGYAYIGYTPSTCSLEVGTASDVTKSGNTQLTCSCLTQTCE